PAFPVYPADIPVPEIRSRAAFIKQLHAEQRTGAEWAVDALVPPPDVVGVGVRHSCLGMGFSGKLAQFVVALGGQGNGRVSVDLVGDGGKVPRRIVSVGPGDRVASRSFEHGLGLYRLVFKVVLCGMPYCTAQRMFGQGLYLPAEAVVVIKRFMEDPC